MRRVRICFFSEEGTESGDGDHDDGDGAFLLLPEGEPDDVDDAAGLLDAAHADDGDDDHEEGEGEDAAEAEFLAERDADAPEEGEGKGEDEEVGGDVHGGGDGGVTEGAEGRIGTYAGCGEGALVSGKRFSGAGELEFPERWGVVG